MARSKASYSLATRLLRGTDGAAVAGIFDCGRVLWELVSSLVGCQLRGLISRYRASSDRQCFGLIEVRVTSNIRGEDQRIGTALPSWRIAPESGIRDTTGLA